MADENPEDDAPALAIPDDDDGGGKGGGAPEWMATFADMVTLLMCFFVLLFAMSTTQQETFKELRGIPEKCPWSSGSSRDRHKGRFDHACCSF